MNNSKKFFELIYIGILIVSSISFVEAKEYTRDKNGNLNINIIDRVVTVNNRVVRVINPNEPISIDIDDDDMDDELDSIDNIDRDDDMIIRVDDISIGANGITIDD